MLQRQNSGRKRESDVEKLPVPSEGFQCCATSEFGGQIQLAGSARVGSFVTVPMSDRAKHSNYSTMKPAEYSHPIMLNIYDTSARAPYVAAGQFYAFTVATTADSCKNGGWQNLAQTDFGRFENQCDRVSYTRNSK